MKNESVHGIFHRSHEDALRERKREKAERGQFVRDSLRTTCGGTPTNRDEGGLPLIELGLPIEVNLGKIRTKLMLRHDRWRRLGLARRENRALLSG